MPFCWPRSKLKKLKNGYHSYQELLPIKDGFLMLATGELEPTLDTAEVEELSVGEVMAPPMAIVDDEETAAEAAA